MLIIFPEPLFTVAHKDVMDRNTNSVMEGVSDKIYYPTNMIKSDNEHGNYPFVSVREFDKDGNLGLTVTADPKGRNSIRMTLSNRMKSDTPVFIIAMPYHGTIAEVTTSENVNLLKAKSVRSTEYSIEYEGQKYNKVLYLAVSLNTRFKKEMESEENPISELVITSYASKTVYDKNQKKRIPVADLLRKFTSKYTFVIHDGNQEISCDSSEIDAPSTEYTFPDKDHRPQVFHFYVPKPAPKKDFRSNKKTFTKPNGFNKDNDHEDRKPSYNRNKKFDNAPKKNDYGIDMFESNKPSRNNRRNNGRRNG